MNKFIIILSLLFLQMNLWASEAIQTETLKDVELKVRQLNNIYKSNNVLVVFDIDNTVLASEKELGSAQWFSWQEELMNKKSPSPYKITDDFDKLLQAQGLLFYRNRMRMPEEISSQRMIAEIQDSGNVTFALTSRGHEFKYQTIRELLRNGIDFSKSSPMFIGKYYKVEPAFEKGHLKNKYGFTDQELVNFNLLKPRDVQYLDGVFYTAGQHKGAMLRIFIKEAKLSPKAIVFVDDTQTHIDNVHLAFNKSGIEIITFRYSAEDKNVNSFELKDKEDINQEWLELSNLVNF
ncbi:MAG: DUF2608 domain-containing protein [Bdellovibrionales bacterium]|nr:DUF2608 domain-containing protein [Bdellovibrionales bacterium]